MKRKRLIVVSCIIVVVIGVVVFFGASGSANNITIAQSASGAYDGQRVQVSGNVLAKTAKKTSGQVIFDLYDPNVGEGTLVHVVYDGTTSSTFASGVSAICTGTLDGSGTLQASEVVVKCPSKYESTSS